MKEISISDELADKIESRIDCTEFEDIDEYVQYVLREVIFQMEEDSELSQGEGTSEEDVRRRLESLGYLKE